MRELYAKASEDLINKGAYFSRPYGIWADMAYNRDAQATILLKNVKKIFDSNNVMNPGKLRQLVSAMRVQVSPLALHRVA